MIRPIEPDEQLDLTNAGSSRAKLVEILRQSKAVLDGHFALHRARHAIRALRFRGIGQDQKTLAEVTSMLLSQVPSSLDAALTTAKVLSPETSGFFLGKEVARARNIELAVAQTDLRRLPTNSLLVGAIRPGDRVVIVNDIAGSGASTEALRGLIAERHATLQGILVFGVVDLDAFRKYHADLDVPAHWLVTANWRTFTPDVDCPGCQARSALIPISEFV